MKNLEPNDFTNPSELARRAAMLKEAANALPTAGSAIAYSFSCAFLKASCSVRRFSVSTQLSDAGSDRRRPVGPTTISLSSGPWRGNT